MISPASYQAFARLFLYNRYSYLRETTLPSSMIPEEHWPAGKYTPELVARIQFGADPGFDNTWRHRYNRYPPDFENVFVHMPQQEQPQAATPHFPVELTGEGLDRNQMMTAMRDDAFQRKQSGDPNWDIMLPNASRAADGDAVEWDWMMEEAMAETFHSSSTRRRGGGIELEGRDYD
ncbi:hypothetical protein CYMTET_9692 [Cymbomonas tetramitiformis]|uniref:Uncharacterized protein n=1 Tax=Cymbomonas tetramitiformis TaxID=36881 RepID=A0AAE0GQZ8_9CHLO|nr:hypothetical protein CYMTET_9692 [Cymbomonas tetramitiformis]